MARNRKTHWYYFFRDMKLKLAIKIFLAFLIVSIVSFGMVVLANRYFDNIKFETYLQYKGMETLKVFAGTLTDFYREHDGWDSLRGNPELFNRIIFNSWPSNEQLYITGNPDDFLGSNWSLATEIAMSALPNAPQRGLYPHLSLFDAEKNFIAGENNKFKDVSTIAINVDENTVGWVGLMFGNDLSHPLDQQFMKKQTRVFLTIGAVVLLVSITIAFILTKHLLAPIKRLSGAAEALGERDFKTRIPVLSKDELGTLARQFNTMAQKLETYERNQKQWLSDISHELRTPLAILIGEIKALQEGVRKADEASLSSLCDEAKHLNKIVNDLHYLSLSEAGDAPMARDIIKPLPVLSQAVYFFKSRLEKKGISLNFQLDPGSVDLKMIGDQDRLMQLFTNLLENALMHTNKPGELTIRQANSGGEIKIIFEDTGPGVSEKDLARLFERLYRADPSRSRQSGSTGLGLSICKSIVDNHKGTITAQHSKLGGLRFDIHLPLISEEQG